MPINKRNIVLSLFACSALFSLMGLVVRTFTQITNPSKTPLHSLSAQFQGLEKVFAHLPRAGYYSDKNMEIPLAIAQFEQAQYVLAPTVLQLNNTSLPLVIFDCTSPAVAMAKIKELKFVPISASNTGIILAANPQGANP